MAIRDKTCAAEQHPFANNVTRAIRFDQTRGNCRITTAGRQRFRLYLKKEFVPRFGSQQRLFGDGETVSLKTISPKSRLVASRPLIIRVFFPSGHLVPNRTSRLIQMHGVERVPGLNLDRCPATSHSMDLELWNL